MTLALIQLASYVLVGYAGYKLCSVRHRQKGIETDEVGVPDYVPPEWGLHVRR